MPNVSVLMSVYNESSSDLMLSINSVLNQTFQDFEFIIVCDNPNDERIIELLNEVKQLDSRINIVWNRDNIGLALSLNHGYQYCNGELIFRMDADDICINDRFSKQLHFMKENNCDLVWSSYMYIDENGNMLEKEVRFYSYKEILSILPLENIVHHPTVLMKKQAFEKAGKYRNFPCAQDYDLWLRMLNQGSRIMMMPDVLLKYRVRTSSTTSRKKYQQICTLNYIRNLYQERVKNGYDQYSYEKYLKVMKKMGVGDTKIEKEFFESNTLVSNGKSDIKNHHFIRGMTKIIKAIMTSKAYRGLIVLAIKRKTRGFVK